MTIHDFINKLTNTPEQVTFTETISVIEAHYQFAPTAFKNGNLQNEAGQNSGSCKLFSFARLHNLTEAQTLNLFGDYYRTDVLKHPDAQDHQNIRNFMQFGWQGVAFSSQALTQINAA